MKRLSSLLAAITLTGGVAAGGVAMAGDDVQLASGPAVFTLSLPAVLPALVVIQPGVSVVRDVDVEVFYSGGYYWTRRDVNWYRTRDHNGGWARIDDRYVPVAIARSPPGQYKHYKGNGHDNGNGKSEKGHGKPDKHD
jgi:hypothetical protein